MLAMMAAIAGGTLVILSALALYLAAPHQAWGPLALSPRLIGCGGAALLAAGLVLLLSWAGVATALFIALTLLMTSWSIVPIAIAWRRRAPEDKA